MSDKIRNKNRIRKEGDELSDDMKKLLDDYEKRQRSERIKKGKENKKKKQDEYI